MRAMSKINYKQLLKLPVESVSGEKLGFISGFDIDVETHQITNYYVKAHHIVRMVANELIIGTGQVIEVLDDKMVVDDMILNSENKKTAPQVVPIQ